ncbi:MAG: cytochrome c [Nitrospinae bacterium]|nr:cytochrome c [Nitrospinota bacterium]
MSKLTVMLAASLLLVSCENVDKSMHDQNYAKVEKVARIPAPVGAVPILGSKVKIDYAGADPAKLTAPYPLDASAVARGERFYGIYCVPCHGASGKADTKIAAKMDVPPLSLVAEHAVKELKDAEIFLKIVASDSIMPKYRAELDDNEAWDVVAYVRELQKTAK